ncbi:MAG TPA: cytochrome c oxidase assembly protein, partial [Solirubrobacteraceae bacterium]|nr:cytochrome c oxidase assembly protein [Solirubrobacteraceae bacterium]
DAAVVGGPVLASALWREWAVDPASTLTAIAALLWWRGGRGVHAAQGRRRSAAFWGGIFTLVVALNSPLDVESDHFFWVHMIQHVLLLTVAPPLLVLSRPMPRMLRALPRGTRLALVRQVRRGRAGAPARWLARPWVAWCCFCVTMLAWHVPVLYDTALRHQAVHDFEHLTYIGTAILFWNHALAVPPFAGALSWPRRTAYVTGAMIAGWLLAITLALASHPFYGFYAQRLDRLGGISPLTDQQLAAGVMWVPGSVTFTIAIVLAVYHWLEPAKRAAPPPPVRSTVA